MTVFAGTSSGNLALAVLIGVSVLSAEAAQAPLAPQPLTLDGAVTHIYKSIGETELRLHVFAPSGKGAAQHPAIVFFFGGGWTQGTVGQFVPQAQYLAGRGMVAIVADYRVFARHGTSPFDAIADAKSAIRWVRSRGKELHIDPTRIAAAGGSSGGHIALSAGVFDAFDDAGEDQSISSKPDALVLFNPAVDTTGAAPPVLVQRFGSKRVEGSPLHHVRRGIPPAVIFHGKADTTVPYSGVERFCVESKAAGNQCELFGYDQAPHGFFNPSRDEGRWYRETLLEMDRFLTRLGYLSTSR
jgi:acetyl esterase/lipase